MSAKGGDLFVNHQGSFALGLDEIAGAAVGSSGIP